MFARMKDKKSRRFPPPWLVWSPLALAGAALIAWNFWPAPPCAAILPAEGAALIRGQKVYAERCATCHGADLEGETPDWQSRKPDGSLPAPPHDSAGHTWHHPDSVLMTIIRDGGAAVAPQGFVSKMPGLAGIVADEDLTAALAYIKSTWPSEIQARQIALSQKACSEK